MFGWMKRLFRREANDATISQPELILGVSPDHSLKFLADDREFVLDFQLEIIEPVGYAVVALDRVYFEQAGKHFTTADAQLLTEFLQQKRERQLI